MIINFLRGFLTHPYTPPVAEKLWNLFLDFKWIILIYHKLILNNFFIKNHGKIQ